MFSEIEIQDLLVKINRAQNSLIPLYEVRKQFFIEYAKHSPGSAYTAEQYATIKFEKTKEAKDIKKFERILFPSQLMVDCNEETITYAIKFAKHYREPISRVMNAMYMWEEGRKQLRKAKNGGELISFVKEQFKLHYYVCNTALCVTTPCVTPAIDISLSNLELCWE